MPFSEYVVPDCTREPFATIIIGYEIIKYPHISGNKNSNNGKAERLSTTSQQFELHSQHS
jgi:hypothetical protein